MEYQLSAKAEEDLRNIYRYTLSKFGSAKAEAYLIGLEESLELISRNINIAHHVDDIRSGYRRYLYQQHAVYFQQRSKSIFVVRVLHQQMQATLHL